MKLRCSVTEFSPKPGVIKVIYINQKGFKEKGKYVEFR